MLVMDILRAEDNFENKEHFDKIYTGIDFLDDSLQGIEKDDVILFGARSGAGKTQALSIIASHISRKKEVLYIALEASHNEIYERLLFKEYANYFYKQPESLGRNINYLDFRNGKYNKNKDLIEIKTNRSYDWKGLNVLYRTKESFGVNELYYVIGQAKENKMELVILDHFHYLDLETTNENMEFKSIIKQIRDMGQIFEIPIIVVAHLRKRNILEKNYVPLIDDFHGSSDLVKIATKVITMGGFNVADKEIVASNNCVNTIFSVQKHRYFGETCQYCGILEYNYLTNTYSKPYKLIKQKNMFTEYTIITDENRPYWFKKEKSNLRPPIQQNLNQV
jgi:replicative DNA helicase